jgi:hypothetical protein
MAVGLVILKVRKTFNQKSVIPSFINGTTIAVKTVNGTEK